MFSTIGGRSLTVLSVAVIGLAISQSPPLANKYPGPRYEEALPPDGLQVQVSPATLVVEKRQTVRLRATRDFDATCGRVQATIAELGWEQSLTRKELFDGVDVALNAVKVGQFQILFRCGDREIGSVGIAVVLPPPSRPAARVIRWVLSAGRPIYREGSFFVVPVLIASEERQRDTWTPTVLARDADFLLNDGNGQIGTPPKMTIARNTALSAPVYLPFHVTSDYKLTASHQADGRPSNTLMVSWKTMGPRLSLVASPTRIEVYAAAISAASASLYLAEGTVRLRPAEALDVLITNPPNVRSDPPDRLTLTPQGPIGTYKAIGRSRVNTAQVTFVEPVSNARGVIEVTVLSTVWFTLLALGGGLVGGGMTRLDAIIAWMTGAASGKEKVALLLGLVVSVFAGWGTYVMALSGMFSTIHIVELNRGLAGFVGIVGGVAGIGVFKFVVGRWFP